MNSKVLLCSAADVQVYRGKLLEEQEGVCACTGLPLLPKDAVLDHDHKTQLARGVLHRQTNAVLGKLENVYKRCLGWWLPMSLPDFLRASADYLEQDNLDVWHPGWIRATLTQFNKLPAAEQNRVLKELGCYRAKMTITVRRKYFKNLLNKRLVSPGEALETIRRQI